MAVYSHAMSAKCHNCPIRQILPAEKVWHIGVNGTDDTPNVHRVPHWERLAGDMTDDHPSDNMCEL